MTDAKRILVVTTNFPFVAGGACEQERAQGIRDLVRYGYEVEVLSRGRMADISKAAAAQEGLGVRIMLVPYSTERGPGRWERSGRLLGRLVRPWYWDGAAYEFTDPVLVEAYEAMLQRFAPDAVWFDYSYLWPLYPRARSAGARIVMRSQNFEPLHYLQESGWSLHSLLLYLPKLLGEWFAARGADAVFAITPREARLYRRFTKAPIAVLPLRSLPELLHPQPIRDVKPLRVFFMGSTYSVAHNRRALGLVLEIASMLKRRVPDEFSFHIFGSKLPPELAAQCEGVALYEGFVPDLPAALSSMDIALIPSLSGAGMQQKIFEPLCRGIATITSPRGLAGYPLHAEQDLLLARTAEEFIAQMLRLRDAALRRQIAAAGAKAARALFSRGALDAIVQSELSRLAH